MAYFDLSSVSPKVKEAEYAVRGLLYLRSTEYLQQLKKEKEEGKKTLPFDEIIPCHVGNPQAFGQKPITFFRQVCSLLEWPDLVNQPGVENIFPSDVLARAREILKAHPIGVGAYSDSRGIDIIRQWCAKYIEERDGFPSDSNNIFLTDGASSAITYALRLVIRNEKDGVLIPRPQYPLYSATITLLGGVQISYDLNEETGWGLEIKELERAVLESKQKGICPRALVIINPGNPTGQLLEEKNMAEVVEFCHQHQLVLFADEVYQGNNYTEHKKFVSFKKVVRSSPRATTVPLFSFHSVSKGFLGECGKRGGYVEMTNIDPEVVNQYYKLTSISLCSNVMGQIMMGLMVTPPKPGDPSYELYLKEATEVSNSLKRRALKISAAFNSLPNISCTAIEGAMYAFPKITLPPKAVQAAKDKGYQPDVFYSLAMLDETGLVCVPGSGFGQKDGTWHFRTTILPPEEKFDGMIERFKKFHSGFIAKYA